MKENELKNILEDVVCFLKDLDMAVPNKVDRELIEFLENVYKSEWSVEMLLNSIANSKAVEANRRR